MIPIVLSGIALMRARRMAEGSSSNDVWEECELRVLVVFSLVLQIMLICLGNRRKYVAGHWIRGLTWSAYLLADTVAIYALGKISGKISQIRQDNSAGNMDPHAELSAFWAPFLLLHLGGPDTITANALEDNELWLRHLFALLNQTGITVYILVMSWTGTNLGIVTILVMVSGLFKYGERVWALRAASDKQFSNSITVSRPQLSNKIMEMYQLKEADGYDVIPHKVIEFPEVQIPKNLDMFLPSNKENLDSERWSGKLYERNKAELVAAKSLANTFQALFADLLLSFEDRDSGLSLLEGKHFLVAFEIIEMELALIYDLFYTKAKVIYSLIGFICRPISFFFICGALVVFSLSDMRRYSRMDLGVTFLLLGGAIFLEIYAALGLFLSDRVACWLIDDKRIKVLNDISRAILEAINGVRPLSGRRRWSNSMGQCSLLIFSVKEEKLPCGRFLRLVHIHEEVAKYLHVGREEVWQDLKEFIMLRLRKKGKQPFELLSLWTDWGGRALSACKVLDHLKWSVELEFDMSILVWHIATELTHEQMQYKIPKAEGEEVSPIESRKEMSIYLSRYMLFLQECYPSMLPAGKRSVRFPDVYKEASGILVKNKSNNPCETLRHHVKTEFNLSVKKDDQAKYVLSQGCRLYKEIEDLISDEDKWQLFNTIWVEMLFYAASRSKGRSHAQQMMRGGELLTHVWLLMAHFGFTDHFQIPHAPPVAELVVSPY